MVKIVLIYLAIVNVIAFIIYGADKQKAKKNKWRIPEATLIGIALIGGSVGALVGMKTFRHKTRHFKFTLLVPCFFVLHIALGVYLIYSNNMIFL